MLQIGWLELLIIVVIAILVIGPKDFPIVLRKLGRWSTTVKKYFSDVQSNINEKTNLDKNTNQSIISKKKNYSTTKKIDPNEKKK